MIALAETTDINNRITDTAHTMEEEKEMKEGTMEKADVDITTGLLTADTETMIVKMMEAKENKNSALNRDQV